MGASRKLMGEVDRVLKKVQEGVDASGTRSTTPRMRTRRRKKFEADLKKEIKKLQRYRDQIKTWIQSSNPARSRTGGPDQNVDLIQRDQGQEVISGGPHLPVHSSRPTTTTGRWLVFFSRFRAPSNASPPRPKDDDGAASRGTMIGWRQQRRLAPSPSQARLKGLRGTARRGSSAARGAGA